MLLLPDLALRRPAPIDFLARRVASIDWRGAPPAPGSRPWLVETCRAELEWARADAGRLGVPFDEPAFGTPAHELWRVPHEAAAAHLIAVHLHLAVRSDLIRKTAATARSQRRRACDRDQSPAYREAWAAAFAMSVGYLRALAEQRRRALPSFAQAAADYLEQRRLVDRPDRLAA